MNSYEISTDPARLDLDDLNTALQRLYACHASPRESLATAVANSLTFAAYTPSGSLAGFLRVITDKATFACLTDAFVIEPHRGRGLPKLLVDAVKAHPDLQSIPQFTRVPGLATGFYEQAGIEPKALATL